MEEQRIGMMYLNLLKRRFTGFWDGLFPRGLRRSPLLPLLVILLVIVAPAVFWYLHSRGQFHTIRVQMGGNANRPDMPRPGGLDPIILKHPVESAGGSPVFASATLLPGLGMQVLQITAALPGHGTVSLLQAPTLAAMGDGSAGPRSSGDDLRGILEIPWGGGIAGNVTLLGTTMTVPWRGGSFDVPTDPAGPSGVAFGGLFSARGADSSTTNPAETSTSAIFHDVNFDQHWPSTNDISVMAALKANTFDLILLAKNTGTLPEPMGLGWQPRLLIPSGDRNNTQLRLPLGESLEMANPGKDLPSGRMLAPSATLAAFVDRAAPLSDHSLDAVMAHLKPSRGLDGPTIEIIDRKFGFGLRYTAVSASIRELRVSAPAGESLISVGLQTNYEDPLGSVWSSDAEPGIVTLQPGDTLALHVRLEIFAAPRS